MILTYFITMFFASFCFITVIAMCIWEKENFPAFAYIISCVWQVIAFFIAVPNARDADPYRELLIGNFTEQEFIVAMIGLTIGLVTAILATLDYNWYTDIVNAFRRIGIKWREIFPKPEPKLKIPNHSPKILDADDKMSDAALLQKLKSNV